MSETPPTLIKYEPIRIDTSQPPVDAERMPLFYIDDQEYTAPVRVPANVAIEALEVTYRQGSAAAAYFMLEKAVGKDTIDALTSCPQVTYEQAHSLLQQVGQMYWGQLETLLGKSQLEPAKSAGS